MAFVKVVKNTAYFKRYQVKYRRRRECRTDYRARIRLINQDKNKYNSPKYRFVVRITNSRVICQVFSADPTHDICLCQATSAELTKYGAPVGHTSYAAAYATGLLLARRLLTKYGLAQAYEGVATPDGEEYHVEENDDGPRPFYALLDVGLARTTTGSRVFGALKGAVDGGMNIPHSTKRFPGSTQEEGEWNYEPEVHRRYIFGQHVADYQKMLKDEEPERYQKLFSRYAKAGISPEQIEAMWQKTHTAIRQNPVHDKSDRQKFKGKRYNQKRRSKEQRRDRVKQKIRSQGKQMLQPVL